MSTVLAAVLLVVLLTGQSGCRDVPAGTVTVDAGPDAAPQTPVPRDDLVVALGTPDALDMATWNIENFPLRTTTGELVASLILSLRLDLIAVQEIGDVAAFDRLVELLPGYEAVLSSHTYSNGNYQKVGFIYRSDLLRVDSVELLFTDDSYAFPRPPMQARVTVLTPPVGQPALDFTAIVVHLKAGGDPSDRARRALAMADLDTHVRTRVLTSGDADVVILGDFNESVDNADALAVWAPFLSAPAMYELRTLALAPGSYSYVPWARLIDHVLVTTSLTDELAGGVPQIPDLDHEINGYVGAVSDHLPVVTAMPGLFD